jgi:Tfp pilus assembly protein PilX
VAGRLQHRVFQYFGYQGQSAHQKGAVLIIALLILLMLGMIGTASLNNVILQQKMLSNLHDNHRAFQAAEAALGWCESPLKALRLASLADNPDFLIYGDEEEEEISTIYTGEWWQERNFWDAYGESLDDLLLAEPGAPGSLARAPRCYRQRVTKTVSADNGSKAFYKKHTNLDDVMADRFGDAQRAGGIQHFRITVEAAGASSQQDVSGLVLQSDYFKRLY